MAGYYTFTDLGTLGGPSSIAFGINNIGQIVGASDIPAYPAGDIDSQAFIYASGHLTSLGTWGLSSAAYGINDHGQVVGGSESPAPDQLDPFGRGDFNASVAANGAMQSLLPVGTYSNAWAINNAGLIVGTIFEGYSPRGATLFDHGTVINLGNFLQGPADSSEHGFDINTAGHIVGFFNGTEQVGSQTGIYDFAFLFQQGQLFKIGPRGSAAAAINDKDQIVGGVYGEGAFLYENGLLTIIKRGSLGQVMANDINESSQIVGTANGRAFVYQDVSSTFLGALVMDAPAGLTLTRAEAINDAGQIVGAARYAWRPGACLPFDSHGSRARVRDRDDLALGLAGCRWRSYAFDATRRRDAAPISTKPPSNNT